MTPQTSVLIILVFGEVFNPWNSCLTTTAPTKRIGIWAKHHPSPKEDPACHRGEAEPVCDIRHKRKVKRVFKWPANHHVLKTSQTQHSLATVLTQAMEPTAIKATHISTKDNQNQTSNLKTQERTSTRQRGWISLLKLYSRSQETHYYWLSKF